MSEIKLIEISPQSKAQIGLTGIEKLAPEFVVIGLWNSRSSW